MKKRDRVGKKLTRRSQRVLRLYYTRIYTPFERAIRKWTTSNVFAFYAYQYERRWRLVQRASRGGNR